MLTVEGEVLYKKAVYILQYCDELQADCSSTLRVRPPVHIGIPPMLSTDIFLYTCVQVVIFTEYGLEIYGSFSHDKDQAASKEDNCNKIDACKLRRKFPFPFQC